MNNDEYANESVKIMVLHDDEAALNCAERICATIKAEHPTDCRLEMVNWSFALLDSPPVHQTAHEHAREADMVFCARSDMGLLPDLVREWFEQLAASVGEHDRAIVLLHPEATDQPLSTLPTWLFLKDICSAGGMDFFARACAPCFSGQGKSIWTELRFGDRKPGNEHE